MKETILYMYRCKETYYVTLNERFNLFLSLYRFLERCIDAKRPITERGVAKSCTRGRSWTNLLPPSPITLLSMTDLIYFCLGYRFLFVHVCLIYWSLFIDTHTQKSHILSIRDGCIVTLLSRNVCSSHFALLSWYEKYTLLCFHCSILQCVAVCCSVLQCVAVCCSVLQCVAVCCSVLQCVDISRTMKAEQSDFALEWDMCTII